MVRDGLAYPNSEPPLFKNVGDLLPVGVADDEAGRWGKFSSVEPITRSFGQALKGAS